MENNVALPLSAAQREIWFAEQRLPAASPAFKVAEYIEIRGPVDTGLFATALRRVVDEIDALHVRFRARDDGALQVVHRFTGWPLPVVDVSGEPDPDAAARAWMAADLARPVDLAEGPPFSYALLRVGSDRVLWYEGYHHIVMDAYGSWLIGRRVAEVYSALAAGTPCGPRTFGSLRELLDAEAAYRGSPSFVRDREYWTRTYADRPAPTRLVDPSSVPPTAFVQQSSHLSPTETEALLAASRRTGVPWSHTVLGAAALYLHRLIGARDVVVGVPVVGRHGPTAQRTPGTLANILPLRLSVRPGTTFADLGAQVLRRVLDMGRHQRYRGEDLQRDLELPGSFAKLSAPVVNVMSFDYDLRFGDFRAVMHNISSGLVVDMSLVVWDRRDGTGLQVDWNAHPDLATDDELAAHHRRFRHLLAEVVRADPGDVVGRVAVVSGAERRRLLSQGVGQLQVPGQTLPALFEAQASATPEAVAVTAGGTALTYAELDARANRLARVLVDRGVGPERSVVVALPRSAELVVALLAVGKAGGAYLPVDPTYPPARVAMMVGDARPVLALVSGGTAACVPPALTVPRLVLDEPETVALLEGTTGTVDTAAQPDHPAYVMYTSGSTGVPKAVVVTHHNVVRLFAATRDLVGFSRRDVWTLFHSCAFDFSVWELWGPLLHGGRLVVVPYDVSRSPRQFLRLLVDEGVTVLNQTPSAFYQLMLADQEDPALGRSLALRMVIFGGEALRPARLRPWYERHPEDAPVLVNMYGITETTVHVTRVALDRAAVDTPASVIGTGLPDLRVYVLDDALGLAPVGVPGELYVAGPGLARGYLGRPGLTGQRFVADPYGPPGSRVYRTGDLARWTASGGLEYLGRADRQVKVRGFRVEPGEIESVLCAGPGVAQAAVVGRDDRLIAYVTPSTVDGPAVRAYARGRLPEFMVPAVVMVLDRLPLTANGKLDRAALPTPEYATATNNPVGTAQEQLVCQLYADVLGVPRIGPGDSFFDHGGHSLLATQLIARLGAMFGVELPLRALFDDPTPTGVARRLPHAGPARPPIRPYPRSESTPLSFAQRRLWFLQQLNPSGAVYNIPLELRLSGRLDHAALHAALADVVDRHETLRTVFPERDGVTHQRVLAQAAIDLPHVQVSTVDLPARLAEAARHRFDLAHEPPLRAWLFTLGPTEHVLLLLLHHIAGDGWSLRPLATGLTHAYRARVGGDPPMWTPPPVQYADYTRWQLDLLGDADDPTSLFRTQLDYWTERLAGLPELLRLPTDRPRPPVASHQGDHRPVALDATLHRQLNALARQHHATLFMVLQAGLAALFTRLGAGTDIPIGTGIAGRTDQALDELVGFFVNTLVLRTDTAGNPTFSELLGQVKDTALAAYAHQDIPFEYLVEELNPTRSLAFHPLFQVILALQDATDHHFQLPGLDVRVAAGRTGAAKFDLFLSLDEGPDGITGLIEYATDLFDAATVDTLWQRYTSLLAAVATAPDRPIGDHDVLTPAEHEILRALNDTVTPPPPYPTLSDRPFTGDRPAVRDRTTTLTYDQLDARTNRLANVLRSRHAVVPEQAVAILMERSAELVVAIVGILKAGGAYVPLDPKYPPDRMRHILTDTGARVVLADATMARAHDLGDMAEVVIVDDALLAGASPENPRVPAHPDQAAYLMYTSGSTGLPKGITVTHRNVVALAWDVRWAGGAHDRVLLHSPAAFDASTYEIWVPLLRGGQIVVAPPDDLDAAALRALIRDHGLTALWLTHSLFKVAAEQDAGCFAGVRQVWTGGEAVSAPVVRRVLDACPGLVVVNGYGPTETTTFATCHTVDDIADGQHAVPIGRPMANTRAYVLDANLRPVPPGVPGELYLAGHGLARGYHHHPTLTAQHFLPDPYGPPGTRMYRTGDLTTWTTNHQLHYQGRTDHQTKIRGYRIEPAEIEATLTQHPRISQAAVTTHQTDHGDKRLVAYVVGVDFSAEDVRRWLHSRLPDYLVPAVWVPLDRLPLTANGKLDHAALPAPESTPTPAGRAPRTPREWVLSGVFAEVLGLPAVSVDDDFFAIGGDSILSIRLVSRARAAGLAITMRDVFERRTVGALAEVASEPDTVDSTDGEAGIGAVPPMPILRWLLARGGQTDRFYQAVLLTVPAGLVRADLVAALAALLDHHDALRARLRSSTVEIPARGAVPADALVHRVDVSRDGPRRPVIEAELTKAVAALDPAAGTMTRLVWFDAGPRRSGRLLVVVHHLVVDGVSWRILLPDLEAAWRAVAAGDEPRLEPVGTSLRQWAGRLQTLAAQRAAELAVWTDQLRAPDPPLTDRPLNPARDLAGTAGELTVSLPADVTGPLVTSAPSAFHGGVNDVLLTALALAVAHWREGHGRGTGSAVLVDVEGHGREELAPEVDLSRTVGWFTTLYPVRLDPGEFTWSEVTAGAPALGQAIKRVKEQLRALPDHGIGFGLLRHLNPVTAPVLAALAAPQIGVNYLGRFAAPDRTAQGWSVAPEFGLRGAVDPGLPLAHGVEVNALVHDDPAGPRLDAVWTWAPELWSEPDVRTLARYWFEALTGLVRHSVAPGAGGYSPSDFPLVALSQGDIEMLEAAWRTQT